MPYNTRRKSLSLPMLGIHVPNGSRASKPSPPTDHSQPPSKRVKRSHDTASPRSTSTLSHSSSPPKRFKSATISRAVNTPPPSPTKFPMQKVDTEGINDDIVVAVIEQLEKTGNRPHLVKELAAVLTNSISAVESSSNPSAIISSRLTSYLRRPWTAIARCPLGKELVGTHPKRTYFFLTTSPRQPIPELDNSLPDARNNTRIISPSLSSGANNENDTDEIALENASEQDRQRTALSPSPELDFSCPELDGPEQHNDYSPPLTPGGSFSGRSSRAESQSQHERDEQAHRGPGLERDEQDFTETAASVFRQRSSRSVSLSTPPSTHGASAAATPESMTGNYDNGVPIKAEETDKEMTEVDDLQATFASAENPEDESEENAMRRNSEAAALLFGPGTAMASGVDQPFDLAFSQASAPDSRDVKLDILSDVTSTPMKKETKVVTMDVDSVADNYGDGVWADLQSPENVDVHELDEMFGEY